MRATRSVRQNKTESESVAEEPSPVSNPRALKLLTNGINETPYLLHSLLRGIQQFDRRSSRERGAALPGSRLSAADCFPDTCRHLFLAGSRPKRVTIATGPAIELLNSPQQRMPRRCGYQTKPHTSHPPCDKSHRSSVATDGEWRFPW